MAGLKETSKDAVRVIHSDAEHQAALAEFETYFETEPQAGTPEADRFELLGLVIAHYEDGRWPMPAPRPLDALRFAMEQAGRSQSDLAGLLGSRSRASEILNGRRDLTLDQIRLLAREWKIPVGVLVGDLAAA